MAGTVFPLTIHVHIFADNITITDDAKEAGIWRKQLREGSNYTITCSATLSTAARTYWTKDGHSGICQDGQRLVFIDIARSDSGTYTCHTGNDSGHTESQAVEQVYIDVTCKCISNSIIACITNGNQTFILCNTRK